MDPIIDHPQLQQLFTAQQQQLQNQQQELLRLGALIQQHQQHAAAAAPAPHNAHFHAPKVSRPKSFNGSPKINVDHWIFSLTLHFEAVKNSNSISQAEVTATLLEENALVWWISVRRQLDAENRPHPNWTEFQALIRERYSPIEELKTARANMLSLRQQNSVQEYCGRFQRLHNILATEFSEQLCIQLFIKGLRPEIALHVELREPKTIMEAMSSAQRVEETTRSMQYSMRSHSSRSYQPQRPSYPMRSQPSSSYHHSSAPMELGHVNGDSEVEQDQLEEDRTEEGYEESHLNAAYDSRGARPRRPPPRRSPGFKRLDDAVFAKRQAEGLCFECGKAGHQGRDCPVRTARLQGSARPKNV